MGRRKGEGNGRSTRGKETHRCATAFGDDANVEENAVEAKQEEGKKEKEEERKGIREGSKRKGKHVRVSDGGKPVPRGSFVDESPHAEVNR